MCKTWYWRGPHIEKGEFGTIPHILKKAPRADNFQYVKICDACHGLLENGEVLEIVRGSKKRYITVDDLFEYG